MNRIRMSVVLGLLVGAVALVAPGAQAAEGSVNPQARDATPCANRLISAHQGYRARHDADTVPSQVAAFGIGSNIADTDLWVTADGYLVQMHEADVSYSTSGTGLITEMTIDQVRALRTKYHNELIPTLEESLAIPQLQREGRFLMIETKYSFQQPENLQKLADALAASGMTSHVIIYSAYLNQVTTLKQIDPSITVWFKSGTVPTIDEVQGLNGVMISGALLTPENVQQFHDQGLTVIRSRETESLANWERFVATQADGLMTDEPKLMVSRCRALA